MSITIKIALIGAVFLTIVTLFIGLLLKPSYREPPEPPTIVEVDYTEHSETLTWTRENADGSQDRFTIDMEKDDAGRS